MPVRDRSHWEPRLTWREPCHYGEPWLDWYADVTRKAALRAIWPGRGLSVIDVGGGDGRLALWLRRYYKVRIWGLDAYAWPGADGRFHGLVVGDAEAKSTWQELDARAGSALWDVALYVTSLPFMTDWRAALALGAARSRRVLVLENLQQPTPRWQVGWPEKEPITFDQLVTEAALVGLRVERTRCVTVLDRRLFLWLPAWVAAVVSVPIDLAVARLWPGPTSQQAWSGRYAAVLFQSEWHP